MIFRFFFVLLLSFTFFIQARQSSEVPITVTINRDTVINTVSDYFFGHNYWLWCESWGNKIAGTESAVKELGVKMLRFGGINVDIGYPDGVSNGIISQYYSYCKRIGAEPFFQLQVAKYSDSRAMADNAIKMIDYFKKIHNLTYVSIGNEPDIYASTLAPNNDYRAEYLGEYTVDKYCDQYNVAASEIRAKYPDIKITGLELSWNYEGWIPVFLSKCKDNVDMISTHYYPFTAGGCTFERASKQYNDLYDFYARIRSLIDQNAGGKNIPLVIGETSITWDGEPKKSVLNASPGTFAAALWFADFLGVSSMQKNLFSVMPWSIREDWSLGFISSQKRPVYHVYKMFSTFTKKQCIHSENINNNVRIYGYRDDKNETSVFAVNWDTTSSYAVTINFPGTADTVIRTCSIPPYSVSCMTYSENYSVSHQYIYTKRLESTGYISETDKHYKQQFMPKKKRFFSFKPL